MNSASMRASFFRKTGAISRTDLSCSQALFDPGLTFVGAQDLGWGEAGHGAGQLELSEALRGAEQRDPDLPPSSGLRTDRGQEVLGRTDIRKGLDDTITASIG